MRILIISTMMALLGSSPAFAWHDAGHRAAGSIAFDSLSVDRRNAVISVLRAHPRFAEDFLAHMPAPIAADSDEARGRWLLEQAAVWPDLIQTLENEIRGEYNRSRWHYINLLVYLTDDDEAALAGSLEHNMATAFEPPLRQNLNIIQALRGNLYVWRDESASDADKAVALCWIMHLTGDLHQPLHNVALFSKRYFPTGDRGGNEIEVVWGSETKNLHAVWDGLPTDMKDLSPTGATLMPLESDEVSCEAIEDWLHHHARLARKFVYTADVKDQLLARLTDGESPQINVSHEYLIRARAVARRQVNLAGHRIAALLE